MGLRTVFTASLCLGAAGLVGCGVESAAPTQPVPPAAAPADQLRAPAPSEPTERYFLLPEQPIQPPVPLTVAGVHTSHIEEFIGRPGQGIGRISLQSPRVPLAQWVELESESQGARHPVSGRAGDRPAQFDTVTKTLTLPDGTSHRVRERAWQLEHFGLMSVNTESGPAVYSEAASPTHKLWVLHRLVRTEKAGTGFTAPKRPLDTFETGALAKLRAGEDVVFQSSGSEMRMLGTIRARAECLSCHNVEVGTMLGAFTYTLKLQSEATPESDRLEDTIGLTDEELGAVRVVEARGGKVIRAPGGPVTELQLTFARKLDLETKPYSIRLQLHDSGLQVLEAFPNLRELDVSHSLVSDVGLKTIAELKQLKKLDLTETAVTDEGVAALRKQLPGCEITYVPKSP